MNYKTILTHIDTSDRANERIRIACEIALRYDSHLVGMATSGDMARHIGASVPNVLLNEILSGMRQQAELAVQGFEKQARKVSLSSVESRIRAGNPGWTICGESPYVDLVVLGQVEEGKATVACPADLPETVILNSGRPVLMIPYVGDFASVGRRVLLLWRETPEAARAARDAMPFLVDANEVRVLIFDANANGNERAGLEGKDIALFLARHGVKVILENASSYGDVGAAALSKAADYSSDLIVMGGYGHSRLREMVLGGASRTILNSMTVPVLMSH
jgi:nucleotide-binding universal stress UspA family protein